MRIFFMDENLEALCVQERVAKKRLGAPCAKRLKRRLADLAAAANPTELIAGRPHPLKGDRAGQMALNLHGGDRLCFRPLQEPPPVTDDGGIDWIAVTDILIVSVGDYHD
jgi:toxin HigB-1